MNAILSVIIFSAAAVIVASAPTLPEGQVPANVLIADQEKQQDYYRDKRSQYQYTSPCAAAAAASSPFAAVAPPAYQVNVSPYQAYAPPHSYYRMPHYRSAEFEPEPETMSFSDSEHVMSEHVPMARYGYAAPAPPHAPASYGAPSVPATGTAYGVFPKAKIGGCAVPVLLSCAPSVAEGYMVQSPPQHPYGNTYRESEGMPQQNSEEHHEEPTVHDHLNPVHDQSHAIVHQ